MSCRVIDCRESNNYHYNPLCATFHEFHGRVVACFDRMPDRGNCKEIVKRVAIVIVAPFAYIALGLSYLVGIISNSFWKDSHTAELQNKKAEAEELEKKKAEAEALEKKKAIEAEVLEWLPFPKIMKAFGGAEKVKNIPKLDKEIFDIKEMTDPVMMFFKDQKPAFYFAVFEKTVDNTVVSENKVKKCVSLHGMAWNHDVNQWYASPKNPILSNAEKLVCFPGEKLVKEEEFIADRIERLINGKSIGVLEVFPGLPIMLPEDKSPYKPNEADSYLKGKDLDAYMQTQFIAYEKAPVEGSQETTLLKKKKD